LLSFGRFRLSSGQKKQNSTNWSMTGALRADDTGTEIVAHSLAVCLLPKATEFTHTF
jgi:hypothetical protein